VLDQIGYMNGSVKDDGLH